MLLYRSCYARYCSGPYSESYISGLYADSSAICNQLSTFGFPSSEPTGVVTTTAARASGATAGTAASATSKAAAERGTGHAVPVLGGLLGALIGAVGVFL
jgi:hypothetical protein